MPSLVANLGPDASQTREALRFISEVGYTPELMPLLPDIVSKGGFYQNEFKLEPALPPDGPGRAKAAELIAARAKADPKRPAEMLERTAAGRALVVLGNPEGGRGSNSGRKIPGRAVLKTFAPPAQGGRFTRRSAEEMAHAEFGSGGTRPATEILAAGGAPGRGGNPTAATETCLAQVFTPPVPPPPSPARRR